MPNIPATVAITLLTLTLTLTAVSLLRKRDTAALSVTIVFAGLLVTGHLSGRARTLYPFLPWKMYTTPQAPKVYFRFPARDVLGGEYDYPFEALSPATPGPLRGYSTLGPIAWRLVSLRGLCQCSSGDPALDAMIRALVEVHERRTGARISSFRILSFPARLGPIEQQPLVIYTWAPRAFAP